MADKKNREAAYYEREGTALVCRICPHNCVINSGKRGFCRNRINRDGVLYSLTYGHPCALNIDPVEKKPLYHFKPQTQTLSLGTAGCNFRCLNCQNWSISQSASDEIKGYKMTPDAILALCHSEGVNSISYTYTEPTVFYEYMYDIAAMAKKQNIANIMVSNGYINTAPLNDLAPLIDAANIDIKTFDVSLHQKLTKGYPEAVQNTLLALKNQGVWIEMTNLLIPDWTAQPQHIEKMCQWLVENGFHQYPLHFNRFSPMYKLPHVKATPVSDLEKAREIALDKGMNYVYIGNVPGHNAMHTICPGCQKTVVKRTPFRLLENKLVNGCCPFCNEKIAGVW